MLRNLGLAALVCAVFFVPAPARAVDVWDLSTEQDDGPGTDNGLYHGVVQNHDLGGQGGLADSDYYTLDSAGRSSYEVIIDGTTGDENFTSTDIQRLNSSGTSVLQSSVGLAGYSAAMRWQNTNASSEVNLIRVQGAACGSACSTNDVYRIRFYDSTYSIPRFNNTGTQTTVVLVASMVSFSCSASFHFYNTAGTFLGTATNTYSARELFVLPTSSLAFANGQAGSIIIAHTCGYGGLAGKATALEPSTGFAFDTQLNPRIL